ncbi:hypothetical protein ABZ826_00360 [Streptomyces sp. NPDC047515]|uniref:hypothetical protein n=1 Tax=Streptomyces sp. NPDC047515 TaxID=3155380 RepID=UPI0033D344EB
MSNEEQTTPDEDLKAGAVPQIPAVIRLREVPAAAEARESLLQAIAAEARAVTAKHPGQASGALEELARAYALVTTGVTAQPVPSGVADGPGLQARAGGHQVGLCLELEP